MDWLTNIFSSGASKLVDSLGNSIDKLVTSDEERLQLKNELVASINTFKLETEKGALEHEREITKRWTSDNEHVITRLVRPLSFIFTLSLFASILISDGNIGEFSIKAAYIPVIETLLATMVVAYFGSRGVEKSMKHFRGGLNDNG